MEKHIAVEFFKQSLCGSQNLKNKTEQSAQLEMHHPFFISFVCDSGELGC